MCIQNNNTHLKNTFKKHTEHTSNTEMFVGKELWKQDIGIFKKDKNK